MALDSSMLRLPILAANRSAQDALDASGRSAFSSASASPGRFTRVPPLHGSITVTGFPYLRAISRHRRDCTLGCSQST